jgi:hypothetical protein
MACAIGTAGFSRLSEAHHPTTPKTAGRMSTTCAFYASEDRVLAKRLARKLEKTYFRTVFFDESQQYKIAGQDLAELL